MKKYLATARLCLVEKTYFGFGYLAGQYVLKAVALGAMLLIWRSLFSQGADTGGMTLNQFYVYTILSTLLEPLLNVRTPASSWLHAGTLLSLYQRPAPVYGQLIAHTVGGWPLPIAIMAVPTLAVVFGMSVDMRPASGWFFLSLLLSVAQGFSVDMLFACLMIRLKTMEWSVHMLREALTALFTGAVIPFTALPWGVGKYLALTPLGTLAGAPLSIYTGMAGPAALIPAQLFWTALCWPLATALFKKSQERMASYGG